MFPNECSLSSVFTLLKTMMIPALAFALLLAKHNKNNKKLNNFTIPPSPLPLSSAALIELLHKWSSWWLLLSPFSRIFEPQ